jgi:conjugative transposon TraN protein
MCRFHFGVICALVLGVAHQAMGQETSLPVMWLTTAKTTVVVSHFRIRSVDRGSRDVLVQKIEGVDTVLELKAARPGFVETNLTILTGDGLVHMYLVRFSLDPPTLRYVIDAGGSSVANSVSSNSPPGITDAELEDVCDSILKAPKYHCGRSARSCGARAAVSGIYTHDRELFLRFRIKNKSNIGYDIGETNFYIRDNNQAKRTANQDLTEEPQYYRGSHEYVSAKESIDFVAVFPKFTIPDKKTLFIIFKEQDGGRLLKLKISNRRLLKAEII